MSNVLNVTDPNPLIKPQQGVETPESEEPELVVIDEREQREARQRLREREQPEDRRDRRAEDDREEDDVDERRLGRGREEPEDEDEDEREQRRLRNRLSKQAGKRRRQEAMNRDKTELRYLRQRNEELERQNMQFNQRLSRVETQTLDGRLQDLRNRLEQADHVLAAAVEAQNGEDVVKVTKIRDQLLSNINKLEQAKQNHTQQVQQQTQHSSGQPVPQRGQRAAAPDPYVVREAARFQSRNKWFDPSGTDEDSAIVFALDNALSQEADWDPTTPEYWDELERRAARYLPHRFEKSSRNARDERDEDDEDEDELDDREARDTRRPAAPSRNESRGPRMPSRGSGGGKKVTFHLSEERRRALEENGLWEDPVLRKRYLKKFQAWDQENGRNGRNR